MRRESSESGLPGSAPNNSMQLMALRAAADAERHAEIRSTGRSSLLDLLTGDGGAMGNARQFGNR